MTEEDFVRLIDGTLQESDRIRIKAHLRSCKRCFQIYRDSAIYSGLWVTGEQDFKSSEELVETGLQIASLNGAADPELSRSSRGGKQIRNSKRRRLLISMAAVVVLIVIGVGIKLLYRNSGNRLDQFLVSPVRRAVETASMWSDLVIPGGENALTGNGSVYRSGHVPLSDSLKSSLGRLADTYTAGDASVEAITWLIAGYYSTGQMDMARDLVSESHDRYEKNSKLAILEALIAYSDGEYARAETILRRVTEVEPANYAAQINLAVVLRDQGKTDEARGVLAATLSRRPDAPLERRARYILSNIQD